MRTFYEFFAGGGMVRAGLGPGWTCLFANDADPRKAASYAGNWGAAELRIGDVAALAPGDLPGRAGLAWASFPCQDLSLAGRGSGLRGARSSTFWPFLALMRGLARDGRAPPLIVLENVCGTLTSGQGRDFPAICAALAELDYRAGALVVDAVRFVPQSRPRLFVIAARAGAPVPRSLTSPSPQGEWTTRGLRAAHGRLGRKARENWIWWRLPAPPARNAAFSDLIESRPGGAVWRTDAQTRALIETMSPANRAKLAAARASGRRTVGAVYKRTRPNADGVGTTRAEVRFDGVAGCLRTPAGGSSRQTVLVVEGGAVRSRLLSPREAARLMGLPEDYRLPRNDNDAYRLAGDGVAVPVVRHIAENILEPLLAAPEARRAHGRAA